MEELKIKQVSLALEAQYIKQREIKLNRDGQRCFKLAQFANDEAKSALYRGFGSRHRFKASQLKEHRKKVVATEARATNLARAYLKGKPMSWAENKYDPTNPPDWNRVARMVQKYERNGFFYRPADAVRQKELLELLLEWAKT